MYSAPKISLEFWWRNFAGQVFPNDSLSFIIDDEKTPEILNVFVYDVFGKLISSSAVQKKMQQSI